MGEDGDRAERWSGWGEGGRQEGSDVSERGVARGGQSLPLRPFTKTKLHPQVFGKGNTQTRESLKPPHKGFRRNNKENQGPVLFSTKVPSICDAP